MGQINEAIRRVALDEIRIIDDTSNAIRTEFSKGGYVDLGYTEEKTNIIRGCLDFLESVAKS